jgi:hypothetical protein
MQFPVKKFMLVLLCLGILLATFETICAQRVKVILRNGVCNAKIEESTQISYQSVLEK